jgi:hypothetical protein
LDTETIRLDEERATLERILELLDTLLPSISNSYVTTDCHNYNQVPTYHGITFIDTDGGGLPQMTATNVCQFLGMEKAPEQQDQQGKDSYRITIPQQQDDPMSQFYPESSCHQSAYCANPSGYNWLEKCETVTENGITFCLLTFSGPNNQPAWNTMHCQCTG